jgi:protein ImuA
VQNTGEFRPDVTRNFNVENGTGTYYPRAMTAHLLPHQLQTDRPALAVLGEMQLVRGRVHELCGPARHMLAMLVAGAAQGEVFWIAPAWEGDALHPDGMAWLAGPERFTFVTPRRPADLLWTLEEVLRSGAVPLAVAELPTPPGMTAVRRLHLAAETGAAEGMGTPLGLILTPGEGGARGVETRWHMAQAHAPGTPGWRLSRRRARTLPPQDWHLAGRPRAWRLTPA